MNKQGKALMGDIKGSETASPNVRTDLVDTSANVRTDLQIAFGAAETSLALQLGINLQASANVRTELAVVAYNAATRHMVEAGLLLASVRAEMDGDAFVAMLEERGMHKRRAYELMQGASFAARLPEDQRAQVLALPKTKVMALASADPKVVEAMLEDGDSSLDLLSVRALRERIRDLEANLTDTQTQRDTAEADLEAARKRLLKSGGPREDRVPVVVADIRAELTALTQQVQLCLAGIRVAGADLMNHNGPAHDWHDPTIRLAVSGLMALRLQLDGVARNFIELLPDAERDEFELPAMAYLSPQEVLETAKAYERLTKLHEHEKALRQWERDQERPKGKGRPTARPEAPKA